MRGKAGLLGTYFFERRVHHIEPKNLQMPRAKTFTLSWQIKLINTQKKIIYFFVFYSTNTIQIDFLLSFLRAGAKWSKFAVVVYFFRPKIFNVMLEIMEFLKIWTRIVSDMSTTTFLLTSLTPELLLVKNNQVNLFLSWCWWVNESTVKVKVMVLQILHFLSLARCEIEVIKSHEILHLIP